MDTWRRDIPALTRRVHGRRLAYLDSAATALKPQAVIDAITRVYTHDAGNVHRGTHALSEAASEAYEQARAGVAAFLGASTREIVFTSGATASINLVAQTWGRANLGPGDVVLVSELEHHSNLVPWQLVCAERGAIVRAVPVDDAGRIDPAEVAARLDPRVKLVAITQLSNVTGTMPPLAEIVRLAHDAGARVLVDGAQAIAHVAVDVGALGADFYAWSAHKLFGPTGTGVLWAKAELLEAMPPWQGGGAMVTSVDLHGARFREPPARFEAGTPNIAGVIGLGAAIAHVRALGRAAVAAHEARLFARVVRVVAEAGARILGEPEAAVVSFTIPGAHAHDVVTIADGEGVAVRGGHHCAQPLHARFGVPASARASIAYYNDDADLDQLAAALARVREVFP